jgi:hypothetical protein
MGFENPIQPQTPKTETKYLGNISVTVKKLKGQSKSDPAVIEAKANAEKWVRDRFTASPEQVEAETDELEDLPEGASIAGLVALGDRLVDKKTGKQYRIPKLPSRGSK